MWWRLFGSHPASVGESYLAHLRHACGFAGAMLAACLACFIHALFPFLFERTGSTIIHRLHDRMVVNRSASGLEAGPPAEVPAE
ncbi:MAG: DUF6356 family protein [Candidatus Andeanibacterium colombiense]|uniref:DUF6356 family protein n=1 Tax=Candidatus Andeanibacterium colombiense TaxID=3121345 RepID=A0AAJ6BMP3_9SPHN|nr:MAG: DUF6356 family protein [Sphingomonadaceae bacterium]